jgi:hypothetical protein
MAGVELRWDHDGFKRFRTSLKKAKPAEHRLARGAAAFFGERRIFRPGNLFFAGEKNYDNAKLSQSKKGA